MVIKKTSGRISQKGKVNRPSSHIRRSGKITKTAITRVIQGKEYRFELQKGETPIQFEQRVSLRSSDIRKARAVTQDTTSNLLQRQATARLDKQKISSKTQLQREAEKRLTEQVASQRRTQGLSSGTLNTFQSPSILRSGLDYEFTKQTPEYKSEVQGFVTATQETQKAQKILKAEQIKSQARINQAKTQGEADKILKAEKIRLASLEESLGKDITIKTDKARKDSFKEAEQKLKDRKLTLDNAKKFDTSGAGWQGVLGKKNWIQIQKNIKQDPLWKPKVSGLQALNPFNKDAKFNPKMVEAVRRGATYKDFIQGEVVRPVSKVAGTVGAGVLFGVGGGLIASIGRVSATAVKVAGFGLTGVYAKSKVTQIISSASRYSKGGVIGETLFEVAGFGLGARLGSGIIKGAGIKPAKSLISFNRASLITSKSTSPKAPVVKKVTISQYLAKQIKINQNRYITAEKQSIKILRPKQQATFKWQPYPKETFYPYKQSVNLDMGLRSISTIRTTKKPAGFDVPEIVRITSKIAGQPTKRIVVDPFGIGIKPTQRQLQLFPKQYDPLSSISKIPKYELPFFKKAMLNIQQSRLSQFGIKDPIPIRAKVLLQAYSRTSPLKEVQLKFKSTRNPIIKLRALGKKGQISLSRQIHRSGGIFDKPNYNNPFELTPLKPKENIQFVSSKPLLQGTNVRVGIAPIFSQDKANIIRGIKITDVKLKLDTKQLTSLGLSRSLISISKIDTKQISKVIQKPKVAQAQVNIQSQIQVPELKLISVLKPTLNRQKVYKPLSIERPTPFPKVISYMPSVPFSFGKKRRGVEGFDVLVRRAGRFVKINPMALSREEALDYGAFKIDTSALASFKINPSFGRVDKSSYSFSKGAFSRLKKDLDLKEGIYIEKSRKRISTAGELKEITFKGLQVRKSKSKFGKLLSKVI